MRVKLILPALTSAAKDPRRRRINYSLWPPLGLATLAGYLRDDDEIRLCDEHVEPLDLCDQPDLVAIQVYITSARRAYEIADHYRGRGVHGALGGVHVTSLPNEAVQHADTIFLGPGEDTWPVFLSDFRNGRPGRIYRSTVRTLVGQPPVRRDLIKRHLYLAPNSLVVSRGCPHHCDFCSNSAFFRGGKSFYTQAVDQALAEIERLPGRHLYFLDDHIFGEREFACALFDGLKGTGRLWQAAGTVASALDVELLDRAAKSGLRSLLVGFETLSEQNLRLQHKSQNLDRSYETAIRNLHEAGVLVNATFVFGMDDDDASVFNRTVEWAIAQGIETATFHILTPYPGTPHFQRLEREGRILTRDWDLYDTAHVVFQPARMPPEELEAGYRRARDDFYRWGSILRSASSKPRFADRARHIVYAGGWGACDGFWRLVARAGQVHRFSPLLEAVLAGFGRYPATRDDAVRTPGAAEPEPLLSAPNAVALR
jgi:radical SAM superfamily enzyme YgiQ (UPF0313 family)